MELSEFGRNSLILLEFCFMIFFGISVSILISFFCVKKKKTATRSSRRSQKSKKTKRESRVCNQKSGLLNDDPDLKSNMNKQPPPGTPTTSPPPQPNEADELQSTDLASNIFPGGIKPATPVLPPAKSPADPGAKTGIAAETKREGSKTMVQGQFIPNKSQFVANPGAGGAGTPAASVVNRELDPTQNPGASTTNVEMQTAALTPAA